MTRVKICGLTRAEDVRAAVEAGADLVGFVFAPSSRQIGLNAARELARLVPPGVARVGVFVDPEPAEVHGAIQAGCIDLVQLHGNETPDFCARFPGRAIKARALRQPEDLLSLEEYAPVVQGFLLDAYHPSLAGGTGRTFNWEWLDRPLSRPFLLAGGLNPDNVGQAISTAKPWAVDVSSGVEASPGVKDPALIREFIARAGSPGQRENRAL